MGYRSQIALKTTTEGWILLKRFNDKIENPDERPLRHLTVGKTPTGYYKISHGYIKWYEGDPQVINFNEAFFRGHGLLLYVKSKVRENSFSPLLSSKSRR